MKISLREKKTTENQKHKTRKEGKSKEMIKKMTLKITRRRRIVVSNCYKNVKIKKLQILKYYLLAVCLFSNCCTNTRQNENLL